jgi:glyoxylase-like metal-dependent hydrolase (beta-lactamase superfamily II)
MEPPEPGPDRRVLAVRVGTLDTTRSDVYLNYHLYGEPDGPATLDYFFWVIQHAGRCVVVDTGFSEQAARRRGRTFLLHPVDALRQLGIDPLGVEDLVVTHGHYDHVGNVALFPRARVHMAATEYAFWTSPTASHAQFSFYAEDQEIDHLRACHEQGRLRLFTGGTDVATGIRIEEVGGHTPGQAVVRVTTAEGQVLLASDAVHLYEELERNMPFTALSDLPAMYAAFHSIRSDAEAGAVTVVPGHDPDVLARFPACTDLPARSAVVITSQAAHARAKGPRR